MTLDQPADHRSLLVRLREALRKSGGARESMFFGGPGKPLDWRVPMESATNGDQPTVSDGFHPKGDVRFRGGQGHRGLDWMYWKGPKHPRYGEPLGKWESKGFYCEPDTRALAALGGVVTVARQLKTGWAVAIDHGARVETAYHHLSAALVQKGQVVEAGQPVGVVGGSPVGYGLVHLHFDFVVDGKFVDSGPYVKTWAKPGPRVRA